MSDQCGVGGFSNSTISYYLLDENGNVLYDENGDPIERE
jgi:hypothetical protein